MSSSSEDDSDSEDSSSGVPTSFSSSASSVDSDDYASSSEESEDGDCNFALAKQSLRLGMKINDGKHQEFLTWFRQFCPIGPWSFKQRPLNLGRKVRFSRRSCWPGSKLIIWKDGDLTWLEDPVSWLHFQGSITQRPFCQWCQSFFSSL